MARRSGHGVAERACGYRGGKDCSVKPNPLLKHHSGDFVPEFVDLRRFLHRSTRFREPIAGVAQVAFDEMEQRMEPGADRSLDVLGDIVRRLPVALLDEPERLRLARQAAGRLRVGFRGGLELGRRHSLAGGVQARKGVSGLGRQLREDLSAYFLSTLDLR